MVEEGLLAKVHDLSDLELATLICLVTDEHCIIDTDPSCLDDLVQELQLVASKVFGLTNAVIDCSQHTTLDDFTNAILCVDVIPSQPSSPRRSRQDSYFRKKPSFGSMSRSPDAESSPDNKTMASVIIAKNLDEAPEVVQIQALELLRTKRLYTRTSMEQAPKKFLLMPVIAGGAGPRLTKYLNDFMFISHFHDPEDGFANLEEMYTDGASISSVIKKGASDELDTLRTPRVTAEDIEVLQNLSNTAELTVEVRQYQQNIISFLRLHRAVAGGVSAVATQHFAKLAKCLAPLHNLNYVTPSIVGLAAKKIYVHRIEIVEPEHERSMQWGSDLEAVAALLEGVGAEEVIEDVLGSGGAEAPL